MEKRLVVFIVFSLLIIFSYPFFINMMTGKPPNAPLSSLNENQGAIETEAKTTKEDGAQEKKTDEEVASSPSLEASPLDASVPVAEVLKIVESDYYRVTLSSLGGTIKKWELKKYSVKDEETQVARVIQLVPEKMSISPLALSLVGEATRTYVMDDTPLMLNNSTPEGLVRMSYIGNDGKKIIKELRFTHDRYVVDLKIETEGYSGGYDISLGSNFGIYDWSEQIGANAGAVALIDNEVIRETPAKMEEASTAFSGTTKWFGLQDKYFLTALVPQGEGSVGAVTFEKEAEQEISAKIRLEPGDGVDIHNFMFYVGPKEYDRLNALDVNLDESIDFGWFIFGSLLPVRMIAKPIFYLLRFFYQFTHNYGLSIILVTVLIKVAFFPITQKSMRSMKSMASIQPKIAAIKKQWANNKEKMNAELMRLYKTEKVNPVGGCLPMLIQIPVFISLFNILYTTIELRQAPFFFWVTDLSLKDPYYVLPIIMGGTMFLQQYTAPKTMDAMQYKIMLFLPIVYTFFFLNFPSGLVLYWLVNNTLTIVQQQLMKRETVKEGGGENKKIGRGGEDEKSSRRK